MEDAASPGELLVCLVSHPSRGAEAFARLLVDERVAACVNRFAVRSTYRWKGGVVEEGEELLVIKTSREHLGELETLLNRRHPHDVPELIALSPDGLAEAYGSWWRQALADEPPPNPS